MSCARLVIAAVAALTATAGCAASATDAELPTYQPANETKAGVTKSTLRPLVIEWPASDRAALEARRGDGLVAVRYLGGTIEVVPGCIGPRAYAYSSITPKHERVVIRDANELAAALPIHTALLQGKLREQKTLLVDLTIVGMYRAADGEVRLSDLQGQCESATHVVQSLVVGAFQLSASASSSVEATASALGASASGSQAKDRELLNQDGEAGECAGASAGDASPPYRCGALLRVELTPVVHPTACPEGAPEPCRIACGAGFTARAGGCVATAPARPALLDVLGK
jgi:hypothetical protein